MAELQGSLHYYLAKLPFLVKKYYCQFIYESYKTALAQADDPAENALTGDLPTANYVPSQEFVNKLKKYNLTYVDAIDLKSKDESLPKKNKRSKQ